MKVLIAFLLFTYPAFAEELCEESKSNAIEDHLKKTIAVVSCLTEGQDSSVAALSAAQLFLGHNEKRVDFDLQVAKTLVKRLEVFSNSEKIPAKERSTLWLFASGIHGRMADKLRSDGGAAEGKLALECIKKSLAFDENNQKAAIAYATTIGNFKKKSFAAKPFIEIALKINISNEITAAKKALEIAGLKNHALYTSLE